MLTETPESKVIDNVDLKIDCKNCPIINDVIPFHNKFIVPASKRAWKKTKFDFHAGYNKACEDMEKRINKSIKAMK